MVLVLLYIITSTIISSGDTMLEINKEEIEKAIKDIYNATQIKCVLYDEKFNVIYSYPTDMCQLCETVRKNPWMKERCLTCDRFARDSTVKESRKYLYRCHMGLTECLTPIIKGGTVIGFIMIGQIVTEDDVPYIKECISRYPDEDMRLPLFDMLRKMRVVSKEHIESIANIVEMCTSYLWLKELISLKGDTQSFTLTEYINSHLDDDLSVKVLCRSMGMSKTSLYTLSKETFGVGINEYVTQQRMERAKILLLSEEKQSVSEIARACGFMDANYFIKVFKRDTGMTPLKWKKHKSAE